MYLPNMRERKKMSVLLTSIIVCKLERTTDGMSQSCSVVRPRNESQCAREIMWNRGVNNTYHLHRKAQDKSMI